MAQDQEKPAKKSAFFNEDNKSLFWLIILILFVRGFIVEPFKIPSESMVPTLLVGDHLFVSKSSYDIGLPFTQVKLFKVSDPQRGDVVVFDYPNYEKDPSREGIFYIKRIVAVPGDRVSFRGGVPHVNETPFSQERVSVDEIKGRLPGFDPDPSGQLYVESIPGSERKHWVQRFTQRLAELPYLVSEVKKHTGRDCFDVAFSIDKPMIREVAVNEVCSFTVPENKYFVIGDNRDNSEDGRVWGFVDRSQVKGRALMIWISKIPDKLALRWNRTGLRID